MKYCFEVYDSAGTRRDTFTRPEEVKAAQFSQGGYILVQNMLNGKEHTLSSYSDFEAWLQDRERADQWHERHQTWKPFEELATVGSTAKAAKVDHVNPSHYKEYVMGMQWIEVAQEIPSMRDQEKFLGALEFNVRKYLDRAGRKESNSREQDLRKSLWYMKFMLARLVAGRNIRVSEVDGLIGE